MLILGDSQMVTLDTLFGLVFCWIITWSTSCENLWRGVCVLIYFCSLSVYFLTLGWCCASFDETLNILDLHLVVCMRAWWVLLGCMYLRVTPRSSYFWLETNVNRDRTSAANPLTSYKLPWFLISSITQITLLKSRSANYFLSQQRHRVRRVSEIGHVKNQSGTRAPIIPLPIHSQSIRPQQPTTLDV